VLVPVPRESPEESVEELIHCAVVNGDVHAAITAL
jgi:hypothetical protein